MRVETIGAATLYLGLAVVMSGVVRSGHNFEIFYPIVGFITVPMMDDFIPAERPPKVRLHDDAMFPSPSVRAVTLRCQRDVAIRIVRFTAAKMPVICATSAYGFALKTAAAFRDVLSQRPSIDGLFRAAVTSALPVVHTPALFSVGNNHKPSISVPGQIRNLIDAAIF